MAQANDKAATFEAIKCVLFSILLICAVILQTPIITFLTCFIIAITCNLKYEAYS